jgi:hypothetical protein
MTATRGRCCDRVYHRPEPVPIWPAPPRQSTRTMAADPMTAPDEPADPIRRRRQSWQRFAATTSRAGYGLIAAAVVLFFVAVARDFDATVVTLTVIALVAGSVLLAPAIVVGYAVKAAEREDRERGL